jgi:hypothetical protein
MSESVQEIRVSDKSCRSVNPAYYLKSLSLCKLTTENTLVVTEPMRERKGISNGKSYNEYEKAGIPTGETPADKYRL